jgi:hypothetical protein
MTKRLKETCRVMHRSVDGDSSYHHSTFPFVSTNVEFESFYSKLKFLHLS